MSINEALDIIKKSLPVDAENDYQELVRDMINYVELKTKGFTYNQGISDEKIDIRTNYSIPNWYRISQEYFNGKNIISEKDIVIKWLVPQIKMWKWHLRHEKSHNQLDKRNKMLKLLEVENINAEAEMDLLLL